MIRNNQFENEYTNSNINLKSFFSQGAGEVGILSIPVVKENLFCFFFQISMNVVPEVPHVNKIVGTAREAMSVLANLVMWST